MEQVRHELGRFTEIDLTRARDASMLVHMNVKYTDGFDEGPLQDSAKRFRANQRTETAVVDVFVVMDPHVIPRKNNDSRWAESTKATQHKPYPLGRERVRPQ